MHAESWDAMSMPGRLPGGENSGKRDAGHDRTDTLYRSGVEMTTEINWINVLGLITPVAAAYVAYKFGGIQAAIATQQADTARLAVKTAKNKLKSDLFPARLRLYNVIWAYIDHAITHAGQKNDEATLNAEVRNGKWLLDERVEDFVHSKLNPLIEQLQFAYRKYQEQSQVLDFYKDILAKESETKALLIELDQLFAPYLKIED